MKILKVVSVNVSIEKGTIKTPVPSITLTKQGVENDAHAGDWHRQVSLLALESIQKFEASAKRTINHGEFAENITTLGMELFKAKPGDRFQNSDVVLEVTQIGKSCHGSSCNIFKEVGACVMPKEGIFCKVIKPGVLKPGDVLSYVPLLP